MSRREASVPRETLQGTLDLLVLRTLARGPEHGYGITCHILAVSQNQLRVEEGSLYPALHRMEAAGLIRATWKTSENNRRARYYSLTKAGEKRLAEAVQNWRQHTAVVAAFLDFA
jgi:PadR family transcriptional regulator PadR